MDKRRFTIKYKGKTLSLGERTVIMGVLNVTPDSFSDGGLFYNNVNLAVARARQMLNEGAEIIDVGGESTRPGSDSVSTIEEIKRVVPVIREMRRKLGDKFFISIDTYKSEVAREALKAGADIVNSLSGFDFDSGLASVIREFKCPVIIYHINGKPKTMQTRGIRNADMVKTALAFFKSQIAIANKNRIKMSQLMMDPGIGFGKTMEQNLELAKGIGKLSQLGLPIVFGTSRKSHLGQLLKEELMLNKVPGPNERLNAALAETAVAIIGGADIVRTHDVVQTKQFTATLDILIKE